MTHFGAVVWLRRAAICGGLIVATTLLIAFGWSSYERHGAEKLVAALSSVQPGSTQESSVRELKKNFLSINVSKCRKYKMVDCDHYQFSNWSVALLHLAPTRWVYVTVYYQNGVVTGKSFEFIEEPYSSVVVSEAVTQSRFPFVVENPTGRQVISSEHGYGRVSIVGIYDDASVPLMQRQLDWHVDLSCMTKLQACNDPRRVLSGAFPVSR